MTSGKGKMTETNERHHIFCNFFTMPVENCKQCKHLKKNYPENGSGSTELLKEFFPDVYEMNKDRLEGDESQ